MASAVPAALRALDGVTRAGAALATAALALMVASYAYEVAARYLFDSPTSWSAELVTYLLCFSIFTMMPEVTARNGHVAITFVMESLGERKAATLQKTIFFLGFVVCAIATGIASQETYRQFSDGVRILAANPIDKWIVSVWMVYGFFVSTLQFLRLLLVGPSIDLDR